MVSEVRETTGEIRGVQVRWAEVVVEGHIIEKVLSYDVAEAEVVYSRSFDDEMDSHIQMGMFATDRIATDGTMHKVSSATSYLLDGKCIRTAKIEHCRDIEPASASWTVRRADGSEVPENPGAALQGHRLFLTKN